MHLHDLPRDLDDVDDLRSRLGQAREAGELGHDVRDANDLVEHRSRRLIEVRIELRVLPGPQATERLHGRADRRQRVLDLVRDPPRHLAPRGDARRRGEPPARRLEVDEHRVERLRELGDLSRASHRQRARLAAGDLARFGRELGDRSAEVPREQDREEERNEHRRQPGVDRRPIDAREAERQGRLRLGHEDGHVRAGRVAQRAAREHDVVRRGRPLADGHARVDRLGEALDHRPEVARADETDRLSARPSLAAPGNQRRHGGDAEREVADVAPDERRDLGLRQVEERHRILAQSIALVGREDQLVEVERLSLFGHEPREREPALVAQRPRLDPDERTIGELTRLAGPGHELAIALGLPADLGHDAVARALHFLLEATGLGRPPVFAHHVPEARDRQRRHESEREHEAGRESHACLLHTR